MKTPGLFKTHTHVIQVDGIGKPHRLFLFGDIHYGAPNFSRGTFDKFLTRARACKRDLYLGLGDYFDIASSSERKILSSGGLHESTEKTLNDLYMGLADDLSRELNFMKDKFIGLIEGNHFSMLRTSHDTAISTTRYMCDKLAAPYLGTMGIVRLTFKFGDLTENVDIVAHHGMGASRLPGGSNNRVFQMAEGFQGDVYCMGHDHKKNVSTSAALCLDKDGVLRQKRRYHIRTGGFLQAYMEDKESYIVDMCGSPSDLGAVELEMTPAFRDDGSFYVDLRAIL